MIKLGDAANAILDDFVKDPVTGKMVRKSPAEHDYIIVGARRWCMGCNTYQVFRGGRWRDGYPPEPWPGYQATVARCPGAAPERTQ